jgi:hypothetical protein
MFSESALHRRFPKHRPEYTPLFQIHESQRHYLGCTGVSKLFNLADLLLAGSALPEADRQFTKKRVWASPYSRAYLRLRRAQRVIRLRRCRLIL